ncbi:hypothetical protein C5E45_26010 [Nocardia nova]|uniref:Tyr recombinase domain-containing protein n=1 Tax=Nocardia nova TaxID=37330 RepID=A0A2S6AJA9_9NOCA|nr:tyrosine-type recombinase/integrase [Nocardia nova]PPJ35324.1 hypothetical protein C5E45_26010 [Nocardia nova]
MTIGSSWVTAVSLAVTKLIELAAELLSDLEADEAFTEGNVEDYRREIYVSTDKRADPRTVKIENSVGNLQVWQATTGELDRHLKHLVGLGKRRKAKQHKIILRAMMQIAVRPGAIDTNPVDGVSAFTRRGTRARGKVADPDALPAFREQVRAWARGEEIPGTPSYTCGPPRDWSVVWVVDLICGTGLRPHEVFAVRLDDIDLDAPIPYLDVTGTLIEVKGAGTGGWVRQPFPKSEHGWRRMLLPEHAVQACREAMKDLEVTGQPNPHGVLFPARNGSLRNPNNFGRLWRAARHSATPRPWPRPTTSTFPRPRPTIGRSSSSGPAVQVRKREISVRSDRIPGVSRSMKNPLRRWSEGIFVVGLTGFEPATT